MKGKLLNPDSYIEAYTLYVLAKQVRYQNYTMGEDALKRADKYYLSDNTKPEFVFPAIRLGRNKLVEKILKKRKDTFMYEWANIAYFNAVNSYSAYPPIMSYSGTEFFEKSRHDIKVKCSDFKFEHPDKFRYLLDIVKCVDLRHIAKSNSFKTYLEEINPIVKGYNTPALAKSILNINCLLRIQGLLKWREAITLDMPNYLAIMQSKTEKLKSLFEQGYFIRSVNDYYWQIEYNALSLDALRFL
jgi:hypothetical protein